MFYQGSSRVCTIYVNLRGNNATLISHIVVGSRFGPLGRARYYDVRLRDHNKST